MGDVRMPAVAGTFYPEDARELREGVRGYLAGAPLPDGPPPKAVVAPHAGYIYSGAVAARAFAALAPLRGKVERVVLMGPAHRVVFAGLAVPTADAFETPLGSLRVDPRGRDELLAVPQVIASDRPHAGEHCLEVELPFLQEVLGNVPIVPIVVGDASDREAARALEQVWDGPATCVVVSTDLSHYHSYAAAQRLDLEAARAIEKLAPEHIDDEQACGSTGLRALLLVARAKGLHATTLELSNSGDAAGPSDEVVGYGAFAFT